MSAADRNKVLIIGAVAVVAIAAIVFFLVRTRKPSAAAETAGGFGAGGFGPQMAQAPAGGAGAGVAGVGLGQTPAEEGEAAPPQEVTLGVIPMGRGVDEMTREDPFLTFERPTPPTPPEVRDPVPPAVLGPIRPSQPDEIAVIGRRRVAGVKFNERPWAILEEGDETFIVKPGDIVDGVRIMAIAREAIYVEDSDGQRWEVPLRGLGPASEARSSAGTYVGGMPELPPVGP